MTLNGKRIVNTRASHQAGELDALLQAQGATPLSYPCIAILPPNDSRGLDEALGQAESGTFDLLVLTSANAVSVMAQRLEALGKSLAEVGAVTVGEATAQAAREQLGVEIITIPDDYSADALARALVVQRGMRIFLPQSEIARTELAESLKRRGAAVTTVTAYHTVRGSGGVDVPKLLKEKQVDAVTFTSSSTVRYFVQRSGQASLEGVPAVCIGAQTSHTARECGFPLIVEAKKHTLEGMIEVMSAHFGASV